MVMATRRWKKPLRSVFNADVSACSAGRGWI
jgi:hypothetical protein